VRGFTAHPEARFEKKTVAEIETYERDIAARLKTLSQREVCDLALVPPPVQLFHFSTSKRAS